MESEFKKKLPNTANELSTQTLLKASKTLFQQFPKISEDQIIQKKVELQLYLHLERFLSRSVDNYNQGQNYFGKNVSKQQTVIETIKFLQCLQQKIDNFSSNHLKQLLFLINQFNRCDELITNKYYTYYHYEDQTGSTNFNLSFQCQSEKIDVKKLVSLGDWNHLFELSFDYCGWFSDEDWRSLVENAHNFGNLRRLQLSSNKISEIKQGDIEKFKTLSWVYLGGNPLTTQSKEVLKKLKQKNRRIDFFYDQ